MLEVLSLLSPDGVPLDLLGAAVPVPPEELDRLAAAGSLRTDGDLVVLDPALAPGLRRRAQDSGRLLPKAGAVMRALLSAGFPEGPAAWAERERGERLVSQVEALEASVRETGIWGFDQEHGDDLFRLRRAGVAFLSGIGEYRRALALGERLLAQYERWGPDDARAVEALGAVAAVHEAAGRWAAALPLRERALADLEWRCGPADPGSLTARDDLAGTLLGMAAIVGQNSAREQRLDGAEALLRRNVKLTRGDEAANLRARRRVAEVAVEAMDQNARKLIKRLIAEAQRIFGPDDRETLSLRRLAEEYGQNGTVAALEQALAEHERVLGPADPATLAVHHQLAFRLSQADRAEEATALLERGYADSRAALGPGHPATVSARKDLDYRYFIDKRLDDVIPLREEEYAHRVRAFGPDDGDTRVAWRDLVQAYRFADRYPEAVAVVEREYARTGDPDLRSGLAELYVLAGRPADAVPLMEALVGEASAGHRVELADELAELYASAGRPADALARYARTAEDLAAELGGRDGRVKAAKRRYQAALERFGPPTAPRTEAELAAVLDRAVTEVREGGELTLPTRLAIADALGTGTAGRLRRFALAEAAARKVLPLWTQVYGPGEPDEVATPQNMLRVARGYLDGTVLRLEAALAASAFNARLDMGNDDEDPRDATAAGLAALRTVRDALADDERTPETVDEERQDPADWTTAFWAANAYSNGDPWEQPDPERRREFWLWYLEEASRAWSAAP